MEWHIEKPTKDIYGIVTESDGSVESATYDVDRDKWETCDIYESYTIDNVIQMITQNYEWTDLCGSLKDTAGNKH